MTISSMDPERKKVFYYAAGSRIVFLLFSAFSDLILPNFQSDGFKVASLFHNDLGSDDYFIWKLFGGLLQWDANHFLHIAEFGYTYENNLAFFPLFPFLVHVLGFIFRQLNLTTRELSSYLLSAIILNNLIFVKAALVLYDLTLFIFNDTKLAYKTAVFYCISPATVFFLAPYSETMFSFCAFKGMLEFLRRRTSSSLFWFVLSCCLRSNGVTFAGFILHAWAYCCLSQLSFSTFKRKVKLILRFTMFTFHYVLIIFCPYVIFQIYSYFLFCHIKKENGFQIIKDQADACQLTLASDYINWCYNGFVFPYFIVQEKLWNVGFLKYYQWKQIPNFVIAFPISFLILYNGTIYLKKNWYLLFNPKSIYTYGLFPVDLKKKDWGYPPTVFLFFVHVMFLNIWGLLNVNVQILTRLLASSSPVIYWIAALALHKLPKKPPSERNCLDCLLPFEGVEMDSKASYIKWFFLGYALIGIMMFSNGLPWT